MDQVVRIAALLAAAFLSLHCSGGGAAPPQAAAAPQATAPPQANAGNPATADMGAAIMLDGRGSSDPEGRALSYDWSFAARPGSSHASFDDPHIATPSFVPDVHGEYVVELVVSNGVRASAPSQVTISVRACGQNVPTVAIGPVTSPHPGTEVKLSATVHDADNDSGCGLDQAFRYEWAIVSRPAASASALSNPAAASPIIVPDQVGNYQISLVVTDAAGLRSDPGYATFTARACGAAAVTWSDPAITAVYADPQDLAATSPHVGTTVALTAHPDDPGSSCGPAAGPLSYAWRIASAPAGSIAAATAVGRGEQFSFVPDVVGRYEVSIAATDPLGNASAPASMTVFTTSCGRDLLAVSLEPVSAAADTKRPVQLTATIAATGCPARFDGRIAWEIAASPSGSQAGLRAISGTTAQFEADSPGRYIVSAAAINASGAAGASAFATVDVGVCGSRPPTITGVGGVPEFVAVGSPATLSATAEDPDVACGFPAPVVSFSFMLLPAGSVPSLVNAGGSATFTADKLGTYVLDVVATDDTGLDSHTHVAVGSALPVVTIAAAPASLPADGTSAALITVTAKTASGAPAANVDVALDAPGEGNVLAPATGHTDAAGTFSAALTSTRARKAAIAATATAATHPAPVSGSPAFVVFIPDATLSVSRTPVLADGHLTAAVTVRATNPSDGTPVAGAPASLESDGIENIGLPAAGRTNAAGDFTATLASTMAETKHVSATATFEGVPLTVAGSPATVQFVDVMRFLNVGKAPEGIAINLNTHRVFIASEPEESADEGGGEDEAPLPPGTPAEPSGIYDFDPEQLAVRAEIQVPSEGEYLAANPATNLVYHADMRTSDVSVIDAATDSMIGQVSLVFPDGAWQPEGIAVDVAQNLIYVGAKAPPLEWETAVPKPPWCKAIPDPLEENGAECWNPGRVFVIDGETNELARAADGTPLSFLAGDDPEAIVFAAATGKVYSANEDDGTVTVASGATRTTQGITAPVVLSTISGGVAVPGWMEPACDANNDCTPLVPLWPSPSACEPWEKAKEADRLAVDPAGNVYITDDKYRVAKIDGFSDAVETVLEVPGYGCPNPVTGFIGKNTANNIAVSSGDEGLRLYVVSEQNTVALIDPLTMELKATLTIPGSFHLDAVTADPAMNRLFITDEQNLALFIVTGRCASGAAACN